MLKKIKIAYDKLLKGIKIWRKKDQEYQLLLSVASVKAKII